jgi:hypothetical protein
MFSVSVFFLPLSVGFVGLALSVDSGFDWSTDDDDEYESPFADDADGPQDEADDAPPDDGFDWDTDASGDEYESPFAEEGDEVFEFDDEPNEAGEPPLSDTEDESEDGKDASPPASTNDESDEDLHDADDGGGSPSADDDPESASSTDPNPEAPSDQEAPSEPENPPGPEADEPTLATAADARALCDEAMDLLHAGEVARAFDRLSAHWAFSQDEMTQLQREVERTRAIVADRYGDALDIRFLHVDTAGDVLACFVYLERFERHGLRWRFTVYEGADGWTLNDVFFDDEIEALLG